MKRMKNNFKRAFRNWFLDAENPQKAAFSYALGIFLATTPFVGAKALIALIITTIFKLKKGIAVFGVYHVNSLSGPFFYAFSFFLGKSILGYNCSFVFPEHVGFHSIISCFIGSKEIFLSLLVGGLVVGIPASFIAFRFSLAFMKRRENSLPILQNNEFIIT